MKGKREQDAKEIWAGRVDQIKRDVQDHVSEMHNLDFTRDHREFLVEVIEHLADRIARTEGLVGQEAKDADLVESLANLHVRQEHGLRYEDNPDDFNKAVINHLADQIVALKAADQPAEPEPEPRVNPELQLNSQDVEAFSGAVHDYKTQGQLMVETFEHITKTLIALLPPRFEFTAYCVHVATELEGWFEDRGALCYVASDRMGGYRPVYWQWNEAGQKIEQRYTATRQQTLDVIDQFAEFLRRLTENLIKTTGTVNAQLEKLQEVWDHVQEDL